MNIGVDRGHDNYYVSGDYADSVGNFIEFCADNGVRSSYIEAGEFTYENLSQYAMVVLTVPYRRNTAKATMYTSEEIAALKQYTDNGGNVIVCSKSDRDNKYDNCAENSNALLEAIGAHSRIVDGIVVDNELKANEAYRLYFSGKENFNLTHPLTAGVYTSSNANGTVPDPENETGFQFYNGAPVEILEGGDVDVLVHGFQSTWGSHYDGYFTGSSFVPEYNPSNETACSVEMGKVNLMTYEELSGGGWVITSGCTFFSNFDIKDDQDYANKFILRNILYSLQSEAEREITDIAELHKCTEADTGKEFTVEGIVTSNASGYDQDTAFFDCIYVQDETGGINVFPVSGNYQIGQKVRVHGSIKFYCGEIELNTSESDGGWVWIISDDLTDVEPKNVTCAQAMADENIGLLMRVTGKITDIHKTEGLIDRIYVDDGSGEPAMFFINNYIMSDYTGLDDLEVGMYVSGVGIGSRDVDETDTTGSGILKRLRVRNRAEIVKVSEPEPPKPTDPCEAFTDVDRTQWYHEGIDYVVANGLMNGTDTTRFSPLGTLTRAQLVTILYRLADEPAVTTSGTFSDVAPGLWYSDAVEWAAANSVVQGYPDGTFQPTRAITREQIATILYRYCNPQPASEDHLAQFPDQASVQSYARSAINWAVSAGLITGIKDTTTGEVTLRPQATATRAQIATIIMRFCQLG